MYYLNTIKNVISEITNAYEYQKTIKAFLFRALSFKLGPIFHESTKRERRGGIGEVDGAVQPQFGCHHQEISRLKRRRDYGSLRFAGLLARSKERNQIGYYYVRKDYYEYYSSK